MKASWVGMVYRELTDAAAEDKAHVSFLCYCRANLEALKFWKKWSARFIDK